MLYALTPSSLNHAAMHRRTVLKHWDETVFDMMGAGDDVGAYMDEVNEATKTAHRATKTARAQ